MKTKPTYVAHLPDVDGYIAYSPEEDAVWSILYNRQIEIVQNCACNEYLNGLIKLNLVSERIPQPFEVSQTLMGLTLWGVEPVVALINFSKFFNLLAEKKFPAASFIRRLEDLDYLTEPDIFHEIFGHCPSLTDPYFAAFIHQVGIFGQTLSADDKKLLARLFWFTVEFGLINTNQGLKIYGAGILSSKTECEYALYSDKPKRKPFDLIEVLCTTYRYDQLQRVYFVIDDFAQLFAMIEGDKLKYAFAMAKKLGDIKENNSNNNYEFSC